MAEAKLKERTGLDWKVGSMSWSPWNGLTIHDVRMLQPDELRAELVEPLVLVDRIRVKPYWIQLLRGRVRPREISLDSPELTMSVEMLAALAARIPSSKVVPPPAEPSAKPASSTNNKNPDPSNPGVIKVPPKKPTTSPAQPRVPVAAKLPPAGLPLWLQVDDASIRIVSVSKNAELLNAENIFINLPVFGEDATGVIKVGDVKIPGLPEMIDLEQNILWKRPYLELEEQTVDAGGLEVRFLGQLGVGRNALGRLPFLFDLAIDRQKLESVRWFERLALDVNADKLTGRFRVNGSLVRPMTWRADMMLVAENMALKEIHGQHDAVFDEVYVPAVFRQGQLRWGGVRLIGEDISVLGNGQASAAEGVLCVTRLVVSPEVSTMITRALNGAHVLGSGTRWWDDLDTPDRKVRDLLVSGSLTDPMVDAGRKNADIPVWQVAQSTLTFIRDEMREEGQELTPLPNKKLLERIKHENH